MQYDYTQKDIDRFWGKVEKGNPDECWIWLGARSKFGYGIITIRTSSGSLSTSSHRLSWTIANGKIPDGFFVLHQCDNAPCVNPMHLKLGTQFDNMRARWQRTGWKKPPPKKHKPSWRKYLPGTPEYFWSKVDMTGGEDSCWNWTGTKHHSGRGVTEWQGKQWIASRLSYVLTHGDIQDGLFVCHSCDVPLCCNPIHLFLGTAQDNMDDQRLKGRNPHGEKNGRHKVTTAQVEEIRRRYIIEKESSTALGIEFGLDRHTIASIARCKLWK